MLFFNFNDIKINFLKLEFSWRLYTLIKTILITKQIQLVNKKEFTIAIFDPEKKS